MQPLTPQTSWRRAKRHDLVATFLCGGAVAAMIGIAYAAAPVLDLFCRASGYGRAAPIAVVGGRGTATRNITVTVNLHPAPVPGRATAARAAAERSGRI